MANALVSLRLPETLLNESERIVEEEGFSSIQEYVKNVLRDDIKQRKLQQALLQLEALAGSTKITPKSKKEVEQYFLNLHKV